MISSHVKISMISLTSVLSLKFNLNSLVYHRNIFGSSSEVFGNLRQSSESGQKSSENHQKCRYQYVYIIKKTLHVSSKVWILCSRGKSNISRVSADIVLATSFISSRHRVICSIYSTSDLYFPGIHKYTKVASGIF